MRQTVYYILNGKVVQGQVSIGAGIVQEVKPPLLFTYHGMAEYLFRLHCIRNNWSLEKAEVSNTYSETFKEA